MTVRDRPHSVPPPSNIPGVPSALMSWLRKHHDAFVGVRRGKMDCTKELTLTANSATTTLMDYRLSPQSVLTFMPKTANAATGLTALYVSATGDGTFTLTHANNAQVDRTYGVSILG